MDILETIIKINLTFILSLIFGLLRQKSRKIVGFGTFIYVSVGACSLGVVALNISPDTPLPLLGAIVTGIGFLGAGALIKTGDKILGFTTAASIWLFAIFGLAMGVSEYLVACLIYIIIAIVFVYDSYLESKGKGQYQKRIVITTNKIVDSKEIKTLLSKYVHNFTLDFLEIDKKNNKLIFTFKVEGNKDGLNKIPMKLYEKDWFEGCKVE